MLKERERLKLARLKLGANTVKFLNLSGLVGALLLLAASAFAHSGATGVVKQRMEMMKSIAAEAKVLANMVRGETRFRPIKAGEAGKALLQHATKVAALFPAGSINGPSEALPAIWEMPDEFQASFRKLEAAARDMVEVADTAKNRKALAEPFARIATTCKSCHRIFRLKK
jgi:cytochrome c556